MIVGLGPDHEAVLASLQVGLPLVERPYAELAERLDLSEDRVIECIAAIREAGIVKRYGLVVRHHQLGYRANAMIVWDVPDHGVDAYGAAAATSPVVTLCYRRRRAADVWPYNLYCMIHGRDRATVLDQYERLQRDVGLDAYPSQVLFSRTCFKQCGGRYVARTERDFPRPPVDVPLPIALDIQP